MPFLAHFSNFIKFRRPFCLHFGIILRSFFMKFQDRRNVIFRNKYHTPASFLHPKAFPFGIKKLSKIQVFSGAVFGHPFFHIFRNFIENGSKNDSQNVRGLVDVVGFFVSKRNPSPQGSFFEVP